MQDSLAAESSERSLAVYKPPARHNGVHLILGGGAGFGLLSVARAAA
jgi:hypothetical protein